MTDDAAIRVLSADAPKVGLRIRCASFAAANGRKVEIELLTAPLIRERVTSARANADVLIVPLPILVELAQAGHVDSTTIRPIGSVKVGVVVRNGAREPDITSVEGFTRSILDADAIVYNRASSGLYVAGMLDQLGLASRIADKVVVVSTGAAVMEHLAATPGNAIGFGHVTEIRLHDDRGTHLVGALPGEINRITTYAIGALANLVDSTRIHALIDHLTSPAARQEFVASGIT
jgi:molybdate transport system substrate-binding protein